MNCSEFETALDVLVEARGRRLSDGASEHRQSCPACAQLWRDHRLLDAAVVRWRPVEAPASLTDLVLRSLGEKNPPPHPMRVELEVACRPQTRSERWAVVATAACLVLACVFAVRWGDVGRDRATAHVLVTRPDALTSVANGVSVEVTESVVALFADLQTEYRGLADETQATARDLVAVLPPSVSWPDSLLTNGDGDEPSSAPAAEIGRSIGDHIGQAIGFLWHSVPSGEPSG